MSRRKGQSVDRRHGPPGGGTPSAAAPAELALMSCVRDELWGSRTVAVLEKLLSIVQSFGSDADFSSNLYPKNGAAFSACEEWLSEQGVTGVSVNWKLCHIDDSRGTGVISLKNIEECESVMEVPVAAMLSATFGNGRELPGGTAALSALLDDLQDNESLALATSLVFQAADPDSFYRPYLDCLPSRFSTPLYWSIGDFRYIFRRDAVTAEKAAQSVRAAAGLYLRLLIAVKSVALRFPGVLLAPSWNQFRWAMAATTSRQNRVPLPHGAASLVLIPGWDFMNHDSSLAATTSFILDEKDSNKGTLRFVAASNIARGNEVLMNYGHRSNVDLLVYAGFVMRANPADFIAVNVYIPGDFGRLRALLFQRLIDLCKDLDPKNTDLQRGAGLHGPDASGSCTVMFQFSGSQQMHKLTSKSMIPVQAFCAAVAASLTKEECGSLLKDILESKYSSVECETCPRTTSELCASIISRNSTATKNKIRAFLVEAGSMSVINSDTETSNIRSLGNLVEDHSLPEMLLCYVDILVEGKIENIKLYEIAVSGFFDEHIFTIV